MREEIRKLLDSGLSAYRISKDTGVSYAVVLGLQKKQRNMDDMTLLTAEKLYAYALKQK